MIREESRNLTWRLPWSRGEKRNLELSNMVLVGKSRRLCWESGQCSGRGRGEGLQVYRVWHREGLRVMLGAPVSLMG